MWEARFGDSIALRAAIGFGGGLLMAFGARLAGGCTSGHGISGTVQLSGFVVSADQKQSAATLAKEVSGGVSVENKISLKEQDSFPYRLSCPKVQTSQVARRPPPTRKSPFKPEKPQGI